MISKMQRLSSTTNKKVAAGLGSAALIFWGGLDLCARLLWLSAFL